jgi:hypothetical protein
MSTNIQKPGPETTRPSGVFDITLLCGVPVVLNMTLGVAYHSQFLNQIIQAAKKNSGALEFENGNIAMFRMDSRSVVDFVQRIEAAFPVLKKSISLFKGEQSKVTIRFGK